MRKFILKRQQQQEEEHARQVEAVVNDAVQSGINNEILLKSLRILAHATLALPSALADMETCTVNWEEYTTIEPEGQNALSFSTRVDIKMNNMDFTLLLSFTVSLEYKEREEIIQIQPIFECYKKQEGLLVLKRLETPEDKAKDEWTFRPRELDDGSAQRKLTDNIIRATKATLLQGLAVAEIFAPSQETKERIRLREINPTLQDAIRKAIGESQLHSFLNQVFGAPPLVKISTEYFLYGNEEDNCVVELRILVDASPSGQQQQQAAPSAGLSVKFPFIAELHIGTFYDQADKPAIRLSIVVASEKQIAPDLPNPLRWRTEYTLSAGTSILPQIGEATQTALTAALNNFWSAVGEEMEKLAGQSLAGDERGKYIATILFASQEAFAKMRENYGWATPQNAIVMQASDTENIPITLLIPGSLVCKAADIIERGYEKKNGAQISEETSRKLFSFLTQKIRSLLSEIRQKTKNLRSEITKAPQVVGYRVTKVTEVSPTGGFGFTVELEDREENCLGLRTVIGGETVSLTIDWKFLLHRLDYDVSIGDDGGIKDAKVSVTVLIKDVAAKGKIGRKNQERVQDFLATNWKPIGGIQTLPLAIGELEQLPLHILSAIYLISRQRLDAPFLSLIFYYTVLPDFYWQIYQEAAQQIPELQGIDKDTFEETVKESEREYPLPPI